ncbi:CBS domain-containing protein [Candidatus Roizmanbacteria bacterium]|nr:CBS domain-containing protein [Candidatus Roizmanbacteria bacterium]
MVELKDIIKTEGIIKISPDDTLSYALTRMRTSHDAALVFDDKNQFLGVINPYYALIKSSYPGNAKVRHCLYHPPKVRANFTLAKVAQLFIESKIHYLPVFNDQEVFLGIISARHLLSYYLGSPELAIPIRNILKTKNNPVITIYEDDTVNSAINTFKKTKVSKLIVLNKDLKLKGILSYYDLISYLVSPRNSPHRGEREGNHISFYHLKIKNLAKTYTLTLSPDDLAKKALELILNKKIGSVVIVDQERHPIGIITSKDFLKLLMWSGNGKKIEIIGKNLSQQSRQILGGFFKHLSPMIKKFPDVRAARLFVKEEKQGGLFELVLSLFPQKGNPKVIKRDAKNLSDLLLPINAVLKRIKGD